MRIQTLTLEAFGALIDRQLALPSGPAVIVGPNEAGKTTVFNALVTALYGFEPANEAQFPYVPWSQRQTGVSAELQLDDGGQARVRRQLRTNPDGRWEVGGRSTRLGNGPVPGADHVDRRLYHALYALAIEDMQGLDDKAFTRLEERLLGELGNTWQRPVREVAEELDGAAKQLWRPDRRGQPRHSLLKKERARQRTVLKEALDRQQTLRDQQAERAQVAAQLEAETAEWSALKDRVQRSDEVRQLRRDIAHLDRQIAGFTDHPAIRRLGEAPQRDWQDLQAQAEALEGQVEAHAQAIAAEAVRAAQASPADRALASDPEAAQVTAAAAKLEEAAAARSRAEATVNQTRTELEEQAEAVLASPWSDAWGPGLEAITPADLRDRIGATVEAAAEAEGARRAIEAERPAWAPPRLGQRDWLIPAAVAAACLVGALAWTPLVIGAIVAAIVGLGVFLWNHYAGRLAAQAAQDHAARLVPLNTQLQAAEERRASVLAGLQAQLGELPLPAKARHAPEPDLATRLEALRGAWQRYRTAQASRDTQERTVAERWQWLRAVLARHGAVVPDDPSRATAAAEQLEAHRQAARDRVQAADTASSAMAERRASCAEFAQKLGQHEAAESRFAERIRAATPESDRPFAEQVALAADRVDELQRWETGWANLYERYPEVPDPRARVAEAGEDILDGAALETARERQERLGEAVSERREHLARIDRDLEAGRRIQDVGLIQGHIEELDEQMSAAARAHDRLRLAERLIREADRQFREAHQPDIVRRASNYLAEVTGGRYTQLFLEEANARQHALQVRDGDGVLHEVAVGARGLSRGTRDQVFLALRLAVADHLDAGHERLPLILDELFVHWDGERQAAGLQGLARMAGDRQIILFTCHPDFGTRMAQWLGTEPITLAPPAPFRAEAGDGLDGRVRDSASR